MGEEKVFKGFINNFKDSIGGLYDCLSSNQEGIKMRVLRKCEQGIYDDMLFNSLDELRDYLRELHSYTANSEEDEESINNMSLNDICDFFEWSYEFISEEEADSIELLEYSYCH